MYSLSEKVYLKMKKAWEYQISVLKIYIYMLHTVLFSPLQLFTTEILPYARPGGNIRAV